MNRNTQRRKEHRDGFEAFCAEARNARNEGMTVNLIIVRPRETLDLVMASAAGDRQATMILRGVGSVLARIADKSRETMLCELAIVKFYRINRPARSHFNCPGATNTATPPR